MTFLKVANSSIGCPPSDSWEMPSDEFIQSDHHETWFWFIINDIFIRMEFYFRPTWLTKTFYAFHFPRRVFSACTCDALFKRLLKKTPASIRKSDMYTSAQQSEIFNGSNIRRTYTSIQRWSGINNIHNEATAARIIGYRLDRKDEGV
jgi:hypothetical protein